MPRREMRIDKQKQRVVKIGWAVKRKEEKSKYPQFLHGVKQVNKQSLSHKHTHTKSKSGLSLQIIHASLANSLTLLFYHLVDYEFNKILCFYILYCTAGLFVIFMQSFIGCNINWIRNSLEYVRTQNQTKPM